MGINTKNIQCGTRNFTTNLTLSEIMVKIPFGDNFDSKIRYFAKKFRK